MSDALRLQWPALRLAVTQAPFESSRGLPFWVTGLRTSTTEFVFGFEEKN
jgi:hypothetical protein